ncbi:MAG: type II toxin-antitoxin system VapB family antitoxin [Pseudomonadota bacterium]
MKTTLDIDDNLLREAKTFAAQHGSTMRYVYEQALRAFLRQERRATQSFTLRDASVGGKGLQSGVDLADPVQWHELVYSTS